MLVIAYGHSSSDSGPNTDATILLSSSSWSISSRCHSMRSSSRRRYLRHRLAGVHPPVNPCEYSVSVSVLCLYKTGSSSLVHTFSLSWHMNIFESCSQSCTCIQIVQNRVMLLLSLCWLVLPRLPLTFLLPFSIHSLSVLYNTEDTQHRLKTQLLWLITLMWTAVMAIPGNSILFCVAHCHICSTHLLRFQCKSKASVEGIAFRSVSALCLAAFLMLDNHFLCWSLAVRPFLKLWNSASGVAERNADVCCL